MRMAPPPKRMSRLERVAMMSKAEKDRLRPLALQLKGGRRRDALQVVAEAGLSYLDEQKREDQAHGGRLRKREIELCQAITQAHEDTQERPLSDDDYMIALTVLEVENG